MSIIVLGAGTIGYDIAQHLSREHREVVLIESDPSRVAAVEEDETDIQVITGNAADPERLVQAGIGKADLVVAVTNSDEANVTACLLASRLAPDARRVARIRNMDTLRYGHLLGGDPPVVHSIINPEELCARGIADLIARAGAAEVHWLVDGHVACVQLPVEDDSPVKGKRLLDIGIERGRSGNPFVVALFVRDGRPFVPRANEVFQSADRLYVVTLRDRLDEVMNLFLSPSRRRPLNQVTIYGGGNIGLYLAGMLEASGHRIKLVEPDPGRAAFLADRLSDTMVLCGEPLDPDIFDEERIAASDVFVAASSDQEDNLMAVLYAKSHGVRVGVTVLSRPQIARLVAQLGVDSAILPQQVAIGTILEHIRSGNVDSVIVLHRGDMEIIETRVPRGARLAGTPLADAKVPDGILLLAVQRNENEIIIPHGGTIIEEGDRIAVVTPKSGLGKLDRLLAGRGAWG